MSNVWDKYSLIGNITKGNNTTYNILRSFENNNCIVLKKIKIKF